jgi:8-oxo-dGTP diphosphatase
VASPLIVAAAVVRRKGRILLTRRVDGAHLAGLWEFPGGKVERGEDPEGTVVRECREECGIDVEVIDILDVTFHRDPKRDLLLLFYACRLASERKVQHIQVADHAWVLPGELRRYALPPPDEKLVRKLEAGAGRAFGVRFSRPARAVGGASTAGASRRLPTDRRR